MKKAALLFALVLIAIFAEAQQLPTNPETGKITFTEVVSVEGVSKDELYRRGREWFTKTFNSAESVLEMDDKAAGQMIGKGWNHITVGSGILSLQYKMWYLVEVSVKEGRYKYIITNYELQDNPSQYNNYSTAKYNLDSYAKPLTPQKNKYKQKAAEEKYTQFTSGINTSAQSIISSLKVTMEDQKKNSDW